MLSERARANGVSRRSATRRFHAGVPPVPARPFATATIPVDGPEPRPGGLAIYARVSSAGQRSDPGRRVARLVTHLTTAGLAPTKVVSEVGSGLNGHRARRRRLVVVDDAEVDDDPVRDMVEVLTSFCAGRYGQRSAERRAQPALAGAGKAAA